MELFYQPEIINGNHVLSNEESYHCVKVLRHKEGDELIIIDGIGNFYKTKITLAHKDHCRFEVIEIQKEDSTVNFKLHLAIAPTKNMDRIEWFCEKAVEMGVTEISFLECEHSERRKINIERLNKICVSAMKQSNRATLPKLNELISFEKFIHSPFTTHYSLFICHLGENKKSLSSVYKKGNDVLILIGAEGDFSDKELALAIKSGFAEVILGDNRLRTETAALVAIVQLNLMNQ